MSTEGYKVKVRVRTRTKVPGLNGRTIRCYGVPPVAIHITFEELLLRVRRDDAPYQCKKIIVKSARGEFVVCSRRDEQTSYWGNKFYSLISQYYWHLMYRVYLAQLNVDCHAVSRQNVSTNIQLQFYRLSARVLFRNMVCQTKRLLLESG